MKHLLETKKVLVVLGPGGVGKTSCSIGLAVSAAIDGKRVGLLSIDPAKRLAAALGLDFGGKVKRVEFSTPMEGSLEASMLDQKAMFDHMVHRYAPSETVAENILQNELYKAASAHMSGSLEYMALARLQEMLEDERYDMVILDTPPDSHALDFLSRPDVLARFREQKVISWLVKPFLFASRLGFGKLLNFSEKLMGGVAQVTGFKALHAFAEFLVLIQQVIEGFEMASERILKTLHARSTGFILVTSASSAAGQASLELGLQLKEIGYHLEGLIFNRVLPYAVSAELERDEAHLEDLLNDESSTAFLSHLRQRKINEQTVRKTLLTKFQDSNAPLSVTVIEEKDYAIHNPDSVYRFAKTLFSEERANS